MATNEKAKAPRAVIHKRILESAESHPHASLDALAATVGGASPDLVERVLDEYGDPGETAPVDAPIEEEPPMSDIEPIPNAATLTEKQRETLWAVAAAPNATQSDLADVLGVSRATVNKRLNDIDGFDWADRQAFVDTVLEVDAMTRSPEADAAGEPTPEAESTSETAAVDGGQLLDPDAEAAVEQLQERVARLEQQLGEPVDETAGSILGDTELLAKVLRAVMADDGITEDEEVAILDALR